MAKHKYTLASEEGAARYGGEIGDEAVLDLAADERRAVVAAGWVEPAEDKDGDDPGDNLNAKTREELNELAAAAGVEAPDQLANKEAVIEAIEAADTDERKE